MSTIRHPSSSPAAPLLAALSALACLMAPPRGLADASRDWALIALAEARPATTLETGGPPRDVTLGYRVVEIFRGEPGSTSVVVRHRALGETERRALADVGRVILLADPDPDAPGRWLGPPPLRATPSATDAFRRWSAPPDVRPARDVSEVLAEVAADTEIAPRGEEPPSPPPLRAESGSPPRLPAAGEPPAAIDAPPVVESVPEAEEESPPPPAAEPPVETVDSAPEPESPPSTEVVVAERDWAPASPPRRVPPIWPKQDEADATPIRPEPVVALPAGTSGPSPPYMWDPDLVPRAGPGLPPAPSARHLGPALVERDDLHPPASKHRSWRTGG